MKRDLSLGPPDLRAGLFSVGVKMARMATFHLPTKRGYLRAIGAVATRHAQLDHVLRMVIKTLTETEVAEAMLATHRATSSELRKRILDMSRKQFGDGATLVRIQALLEESKRLTEKRNELMHTLCEQEGDAKPQLRDAHGVRPLPPVKEVTALAEDLNTLLEGINYERLKGCIDLAMQPRRAKR